MTLTVTSPVTGGAQTSLTSPTYTLLTDVAPVVYGKQYAVSALGGTQTGVRIHAVSDPFTGTLTRAPVLKPLPAPNPVTLRYGNIPKNTTQALVRKGVLCAANQSPEVMTLRLYIDTPAGADSFDSPNCRAALSLMIGILNQISAGLGDTVVTGVP
jgi:hypothetical protein